MTGHSLQVHSVAFHPTLPYLLTGSGDKTAKLWNFSNKSAVNCAATLTGHEYGVLAVAFNSSSIGPLATASRDGTVKLWQLSDILGLERSVQQLMFGREFGSCGENPKYLQPKDKYRISDVFKGVGAGKGGASKKKKRIMIKNRVRCSCRRSRRRCRTHRRSRSQQGRLKTPH
jgi:WD40 repeat protein